MQCWKFIESANRGANLLLLLAKKILSAKVF